MERKPFIAAYLYGETTVTPEDAKILDRINWAFGLCVDGKCSGAHWKGIGQLKTLKEANPHLMTILSIGGWGAGGYSDAVLTPQGREKFAQSCIELMLEHDFDGVDLDWEYPCCDDAGIDARPEDKFNFTKMMWLLRAKMDALTLLTNRKYHLSMAVGCGSARYAHIMELAELGTFLDEINLMSYDMRQGTSEITGHHTNLFNNPADKRVASAKYAIDLFVEHGVPIEKLVIGAAFYGRGWTGVEAGEHGTGLHAKSAARAYREWNKYDKLTDSAWQKENGFTRHWDDTAKAPYLYNGDIFISYDDPESVSHKIKYVMERGMKGLMYWEYSGDKTGAMLRAMDEARKNK
ncbi:MAG: glycoside hydrolase family 18 protein [Defluviitaleaceae bacterium]|nr:glycoside hydrolase family 18 protein [Defluviitaleaceae bacterium]